MISTQRYYAGTPRMAFPRYRMLPWGGRFGAPMDCRGQDVKKRRTAAGASLLCELDGAYVVRLGPFRALCGVELHALTFIERPETGRLYGAVVDKHISAAAIDFNEAEALLAVEPLDSSLCHKHLLACLKVAPYDTLGDVHGTRNCQV